MMHRVAINGLGRIGRCTLKILMEQPELDLVACNDLVPLDNLAYLLRHDSVYGTYGRTVASEEGVLRVGGQEMRAFHERRPEDLPWGDLGIDIVFDCTGVFRTREALAPHLAAGAGHVILSAPAKDPEVPTVVFGVNELDGFPDVVSTASCTTNCIAPVVEVLDRRYGLTKATMTTIHAFTASQATVDGPASQYRRGRTASVNFIPTSTGAARAAAQVLPQLEGRFDGVAIRGPVAAGSLADIVAVTRERVTTDELREAFREEAKGPRYLGIMGVTEEPIVSSDIVGDGRASVVDLGEINVTGGDLVKVMSWYDNEWGYASQMVRYAVSAIGT